MRGLFIFFIFIEMVGYYVVIINIEYFWFDFLVDFYGVGVFWIEVVIFWWVEEVDWCIWNVF